MKTKIKLNILSIFVFSATISGCQLEQLFPEKVADGVARLTIRNAGNIVSLITDNAACGFASEMAKASRQTIGDMGKEGTVIETVSNCVLSFPQETVLSTDCHGVQTRVRGTVTVSAVRTLEGVLTGSDESPALPMRPDPMVMELTAEFDNFWVGNDDNGLEQKTGTMTWTVMPHVAVSKSLGVCATPTMDLTFQDVAYSNVSARAASDGSEFDVEIPSSLLNAQLGKWDDDENMLSGTITVWESNQTVPNDGLGLDPEYGAQTFRDSYTCAEANPDLALPVSYECPSLAPRLAEGAAPLSLQAFGQLVDEIDLAEDCGFSAPHILNNPTVTGTLGERGGTATWTISQPCTVTWSQPTVIDEDCNGVKTYALGSVTGTGTKTLKGYVSGDPAEPIVPDSWMPATVQMNLNFDNMSVWTSNVDRTFTVLSGEMDGQIQPRTEMDESLGVCSLKIPTVTFTDMGLSEMDDLIENEGVSLSAFIDSGLINAQSGQLGHLENWLSGDMLVDGEEVALPLAGKEPIFNPDYDRATHYDAFDCKENFKKVENDEACDFSQGIGENTARLLVQSLGHIASMVNDSNDGGFEDMSVLVIPEEAEGAAGEMGSLTHATDLCVVGGTPEARVFDSDCEQTDSIVSGTAHVIANRHVTGLREDIIDLSFLESILDIFGAQDAMKSITPASQEAVTITIDSADLTDFVSYTLARGEMDPVGSLTLHKGDIKGVVRPLMQERSGSPGTYDIPTPVAFIEGLEIFNAEATLIGEGKTFKVNIEYAYLDAQNGKRNGEGNHMSGRIKVNGKMVTIADGTILNPDFDQEAFNNTYICEEGLSSVIE